MAEGPRLWRFNGGLELDARTARSTAGPIRVLPPPGRLVLPLSQHIGQPAEPVVAVGERVLRGQPVARPSGPVGAKVHAPTSGRVAAIAAHAVPHPGGLAAPCLVLESDGADEAWGGYPPVSDWPSLSGPALRARVRAAGIVGLGGAAFPTDVKLGASAGLKLLIVNGAECEPYISCDDMLMRERAGQVVQGIRLLLRALEIREAVIAIEENKPEAREALDAALARAGEAPIQVVTVPAVYPEGGEKQLIKVLTGEEVPARGVPPDIGFLCHNVGTVAGVARAVLEGEPLISRIVTVTGDGVASPGNVEARLGTPVSALVEACGGYTGEAAHLVMGGAMMGFPLVSDAVPVVKAMNCIVAASRAEIPPRRPSVACIRCGECAVVCPAQLLPQQLYWHARAGELDRALDYHLFDCIECGCCDVACPSQIPLVSYFRYAKSEAWARERDRSRAELARQRFEARQSRVEGEKEAKRRRLEEKARNLEQSRGDEAARRQMVEDAMRRVKARRESDTPKDGS